MKKVTSTLILFFVVVLSFAANKVQPKFEKLDDGLVKATYYYSDGTIAQEGFFKDGKAHGEWLSYDIQGNKNAVAHYELGKKVGTWLFWKEGKMIEVSYDDNHKISSVTEWDRSTIVVSN